MTVTPEERDAMQRLRNIMEGKSNPEPKTGRLVMAESTHEIELAGPGQATSADVSAMAAVLNRLNSLSNHVVDDMITESVVHGNVAEALVTERVNNGVKVGRYQILVKEDALRTAGKQFYSIYNSLTNDTIADDISLYETALAVVRYLNSGRFANDPAVRKLFEHDDAYTSHRVDAVQFKKRIVATRDPVKKDLYESRLQASMDRCMDAKRLIKTLAKECR